MIFFVRMASLGPASFHVLVPTPPNPKSPVVIMFETRIKDLYKIAAGLGMRHVETLIDILKKDLDARENAAAPNSSEKIAMARLQRMNDKLNNIVTDWAQLAPLIREKSQIKLQGGKGAAHFVAEKTREIQNIRNRTCNNKKNLKEIETGDHAKEVMDDFVELLKHMIKH